MAMKRVVLLYRDSQYGPSPGILRPSDWNRVTFNGVTGWEPVPTIFERKMLGDTGLGNTTFSNGYTAQVDEIQVVDGPEFLVQATDGCTYGFAMPRENER